MDPVLSALSSFGALLGDCPHMPPPLPILDVRPECWEGRGVCRPFTNTLDTDVTTSAEVNNEREPLPYKTQHAQFSKSINQ